ncbi:ABC transporter transmembrane region family protein [Agrilactobacillus composti DSM 18527 = JCM 14202]|uniref:ABC transporter transmembrane region family protein n=1 Tax=Agrilactobacillus composti DSM 18527 = JCM 14202 TaxID=1423734 RepID=A0A0R1Y307_9LACO|nr:ABC transporter ATP-binding protein [Agrilactobacillus composti]KRM36618.1 ABC transporter transmembrane region family protein [Agrilactobacillus composti DSM 18527 = JCM 14202]
MNEMLRSLRQLHPFLKPNRRNLFLSLLSTVLSVIFNALWPVTMGLIVTEITRALTQHRAVNFNYVLQVIGVILIFALGYQVSLFFSQYLMTLTVQRSMAGMRHALDKKINMLPVNYFDKHQLGNLLSRFTNDVDAITNALQQGLIQAVNSVSGITVAVIMMFTINWLMALIALWMIPATLLVSKVILKKSQPYFDGQQNTLGQLNATVQENFTGFTEVQAYGHEQKTMAAFHEVNQNLTQYGFKAAFISGILMPLVSAIAYITYAVMATIGGIFVLRGVIPIGNLQAFIQYIWQVNQPLASLTQISSILQAGQAATKRVMEVLNEPNETQTGIQQHLPKPVRGKIEFKNVSFSYQADKPLIKNLTFTATPGSTVAIVGPTGAGKTTLINLLLRFYEINAGEILLDGVDTKQVARQELRSEFGMVLQDTWLYKDTIANNIRFGKLKASDYEVVDAAKTANIDYYVHTLPKGYQTMISSEADNVSQGQKQLMTIARAIIADPAIMILDEATSSVDTRLEQMLQQAMDKIMAGRTSFVIAHRLSTIRNADLILVMQHGEIIEQGNHVQLMAKNGFYAQLYNSQFEDADAIES